MGMFLRTTYQTLLTTHVATEQNVAHYVAYKIIFSKSRIYVHNIFDRTSCILFYIFRIYRIHGHIVFRTNSYTHTHTHYLRARDVRVSTRIEKGMGLILAFGLRKSDFIFRFFFQPRRVCSAKIGTVKNCFCKSYRRTGI